MLKFCSRFLRTNVYKRVCGIFLILFRTWVICQNQKIPGFYTLTETSFINNSISKQNKKNPTHPFIDIRKREKCAKFQQRILNSTVVGALQSFQFFRQITKFLGNTRALPKFKYWILHHLTSIIKLENNWSVVFYIVPSISGRPTCFFCITVERSDDLHLSWYFSLRLLAVFSPNFRCGWDFLNFFTAAIGPWIAEYFPIRNLSLSVNSSFVSYYYFQSSLLQLIGLLHWGLFHVCLTV